VSSLSAPVFHVPLASRAPLHPPEALQDVAFVEVHVSVAEPPASTVAADVTIDTVG
jgi:hypothetical protein